jgi:hypothetical protein
MLELTLWATICGPAVSVRRRQSNPLAPDPKNDTIAINAAGGMDLNASQRSTITMHNSDYASKTGAGTVTDAGGHVTSRPLFVNAAGRDFHELVGSPTIDAGLNEEANGPFDFDGNPRRQGASTDIGAFEFPRPTPKPQPQPQPKGNTPPPVTTPIAPVVGSPAQSHRRWREGGKLAQISRRRPPVGTTFTFTLNEPASVTLSFIQQGGGRRVRGACVPQTRANLHKPACKRTLTRGTLTLPGHAGTDVVAFQGRISSSKRLPTGSYTLSITATNSAGARSAPASLNFAIVR